LILMYATFNRIGVVSLAEVYSQIYSIVV